MSDNDNKPEFDFNKLPQKQRMFCEEYVIDWNGARSYKVAYSKVNDSTARTNASRLLAKANIKAYITHIQKDIAKLAGVSVLRNVHELRKIAYSSLGNYKTDWMTSKEFSELSDDDLAALSQIEHTTMEFGEGEFKQERTIVKFKVHDKMKAIEIMNKMLGMNAPDQLDLSSLGESLNKNITITNNDNNIDLSS